MNDINGAEEIYYHIEFHDETRREVNPLKLQIFLSGKCNQKVKELTTVSLSGFSFRLRNIEELNQLSEIKL